MPDDSPTPRFGKSHFRQVHLDFHTSEKLTDIGARFNADRFVETLKLGHVDAINLFAKGHHGWCYYPTKVGRPHPNLVPGLDLFGGQVEACEAAGIRTTAYITVGWSATEAEEHPDWCVRRHDGTIHTNRSGDPTPPALDAPADTPFPKCYWKFLCPSGAYRQHLLDLTREVLGMYPTQGLWYDICPLETCWCERCVAGMKERGMDPDDRDAAEVYCVDKWDSFMADCRAVAEEMRRGRTASVFFNGLTHMITPPRILAHQTHYELEDLPTVWGGYDKLPPRARFFARDGKELIAMSGKFHTAWGEFGGYKHRDALRYEAATMLAFNARCNFGDQLHPSGELDEQTYLNIGHAFEYVERVEPFNFGITPDTNLGVVFGVQPRNTAVHGTSSSLDDEGVCVMLLEAQLDFEGVRLSDGLDALKSKDAIVITQRCVDADDAAVLREYVAQGGRVVLVGDAVRRVDGDGAVLGFGGEIVGPSKYQIDYTLAGEELRGLGDLGRGPFLNYDAAMRLKPAGGEVLAAIREPFFDRAYGHYTSHQNTPYRLEDAEHVAAIRHGRVVTLAHPLGRMYTGHGARQHRELFAAALAATGYTPKVRAIDLGSSGRVTLYHQADEGRRVLHVTYGTPTKRGECEVIEDLPVRHGVKLSVAADGVTRVHQPLDGRELEFALADGRVEFELPPFSCHTVVTLA